jgi:uncharacterized protein YndB with AHSA1/START domain
MATAKELAGTTLRVTRVIQAPRERVFRAWTDPEQVSRWFFPVGGHSDVELDARVGGTFRIIFRQAFARHVLRMKPWHCVGTYLEIDPPERLVFTFGWEGTPWEIGESLVTVELRELDEATELVLLHERNRNRRVRAFHSQGWSIVLRRMAKLLRM